MISKRAIITTTRFHHGGLGFAARWTPDDPKWENNSAHEPGGSMPLNEADTRAKLIDPAIHKCGWTEDLIRREETAGTVEIINGKARRRSRGKIDYVLRVKVNVDTQPVALALIEAKKESLPPGHGLS